MSSTRDAAVRAMRSAANALMDAHAHDGIWRLTDDAGRHARALYTDILRIAADLEIEAADIVYRMDQVHSDVRRALSELAGASVAVLKSIHDAGGHVIADPRHQAPIQRALKAMEAAVEGAVALPTSPAMGWQLQADSPATERSELERLVGRHFWR